MTFRVVLKRANGRVVKESVRPSKYSAKQLVKAWEAKYDEAYYVEVTNQGRTTNVLQRTNDL